MVRLRRAFFERNADVVASELLGKKLCRRLPDGGVMCGIIMETEAYLGGEDLASHSRLGLRTKRNEVMYGPAGFAYVYFTYGMHWMLNFVCSSVGDPQAVLIRAMKPFGNEAILSGPARLTKYFAIDGAMNGLDIKKSSELWVEDPSTSVRLRSLQALRAGGITVLRSNIVRTPRIGVDYAGKWKDKPLRFVLRLV